MASSKKKTSDPRRAALHVLTRLGDTRNTLDHLMETTWHEHHQFSRRDRAFLNTLVFGVMRWRGRIDWIIKHFSKIPLHKIDPRVLNILRLGAFQLIFLDRIPPSAAVNTSVEMSKTHAAAWVVNFVNGVLRNMARRHHEVVFPQAQKNPAEALAVTKSFPVWLVKKWLQRFGPPETEQLCDAINAPPPITVRANTLKRSRDQLLKALGDLVDNIGPTRYSPQGIFFNGPKIPIAEMEAFKTGGFQVQDEAAQLVSLLMGPKPGERVLDACAGRGGKTGHMGQMMKNQGHILALDHNLSRLSHLPPEMKRLGVLNVKPVDFDLNNPLPSSQFGMFDKVLLDAPCSGLGVLRRNPDIKWALSRKNLTAYRQRQLKFLDNLSLVIAHSGILVYAVCSMEPEENEDVVELFLKRHPEFVIDQTAPRKDTRLAPLISSQGFLKTFPHRHDMDGFFAVRFKKAA